MGGKCTTPANTEYPDNGCDNTVKVIVDALTTITKTNQTTLLIKTSIKDATGQLAKSRKSSNKTKW